MGFHLEVVEGDAALALLRDDRFQMEWRALAALDPRITVFQEPEFVLAWFASTFGVESAIAILGRDDRDGRLIGFLALSLARATGRIRHAGAHQAIYDGWLAEPKLQAEFATRSVEEVFAHFAPRRWLWRYLPPGSPVAWAERRTVLRPPFASRLSTYALPLWNLRDAGFLEKKVHHKRLRNYANRYRRETGLVLERPVDPERAARMIGALVSWVDLRHGATNGVLPFRDDPTKLAFYAALARAGGNTRVSVLRAGERPVAVQIDTRHRDTLCLCLHGYDPAEGRRSPGMILHVLLAEQLAREGFATLDLTPGDDPWKAEYVTHRIEGHRLEFFRMPLEAAVEEERRVLVQRFGAALRTVGRDPGEVKAGLRRVRDAVRAMPDAVRAKLAGRERFAVHEVDLTAVAGEAMEPALLGSILAIDDHEPRWLVQLILRDALRRYELGYRPYAQRDSRGRVVWLGWLLGPGAPGRARGMMPAPIPPLPSEVPPDAPPDTALLVAAYERGATDLVQAGLQGVMAAARATGARRVWVVTTGAHAAARAWLNAARRVR